MRVTNRSYPDQAGLRVLGVGSGFSFIDADYTRLRQAGKQIESSMIQAGFRMTTCRIPT